MVPLAELVGWTRQPVKEEEPKHCNNCPHCLSKLLTTFKHFLPVGLIDKALAHKYKIIIELHQKCVHLVLFGPVFDDVH